MTTSHEYRGYVFMITYEPKDPAYSVDFPDVPDIITSGDSLAQGVCQRLRGLGCALGELTEVAPSLAGGEASLGGPSGPALSSIAGHGKREMAT